jgi:hypothetical protein
VTPIVDSQGLSRELVTDAMGGSNMTLPVLSVTALDIALRIVILDVYMYCRGCIVYGNTVYQRTY